MEIRRIMNYWYALDDIPGIGTVHYSSWEAAEAAKDMYCRVAQPQKDMYRDRPLMQDKATATIHYINEIRGNV